MFLRRSPFGLFLIVGIGVLLGAALFGSSDAAVGLMAAPLLVLGFLFKIVLFFMLFGLIAKLVAGSAARGPRSWSWSGPSRRWWPEEARSRWQPRTESSDDDDDKMRNNRFEEWHRMAHARQEVDDHTPPVED